VRYGWRPSEDNDATHLEFSALGEGLLTATRQFVSPELRDATKTPANTNSSFLEKLRGVLAHGKPSLAQLERLVITGDVKEYTLVLVPSLGLAIVSDGNGSAAQVTLSGSAALKW